MDRDRAQRFMHKVIGDVGTALAGALVLVGERAGLFRGMAGAGPLTPAELAERSAVHPRYVDEWLGAMAGAGYVEHDPLTGRFELPDEHALYFADRESEAFLGGMFASLPTLMGVAPRLAEAFEQGRGVSFTDFGVELPVALEGMNRTVYESRLVRSWLSTMPQVVERLQAGGRAIDIGCGTGVVPLLLTQAFPQATIEGLDFDERSITIARQYANDAGLASRLRFVHASAEELDEEGVYDLVTTFDVAHDLPDPLGILQRIRRALVEGGTYLMVEPKVSDALEENVGNPFARMFAAVSCLHCVPQSLAQGGPALGACWGPTRARELATQAGFTHFAVLPARSPAMAFYELRA